MIESYSNSLNHSSTKAKDRDNNIHIIDKEDILEMFNKKEKNKNRFNIFK